MNSKNITYEQLCGLIDHTFLKPFGNQKDIEILCDEAGRYKFAMVAINPAEVETCVKLLRGTGVRTGAAIGFPLGQNTSEVKAFEIKDSIEKGATEIDMVINVRALQKGGLILCEKKSMIWSRLCKGAGVVSKVILETCYLSDEQKTVSVQNSQRSGYRFRKDLNRIWNGRSNR